MSTQSNMPDSPKAAKILIVDDETGILSVIECALHEEGFEVRSARELTEARRMIYEGEFRPDIMILDLTFPEGSGEDLLIDASRDYPDILTVIISGKKDESTAIRCLQKGAADFIEKPFRVRDVCAIIHRALRRKANPKFDRDELQTEHPTAGWVELTAPSDFEFLTRMQRFSQILFGSRLPRDTVDELRMIIEEMGRNAIEWGNRFDMKKQFHISYCFFNDRVVFKFEDEGEGFNPATLADPSTDPGAHLKKREKDGKRPGGFGVFLVQHIMDEVVYSERGNVVLMTKMMPKK